jgi:hypothetical protein
MNLVHHPLDEESESDMTLLTAILFFTLMFSPLLPPLILGGVDVGARIYNLIRRPNELAASDGQIAMPIPVGRPTPAAQGDEARSISTAA